MVNHGVRVLSVREAAMFCPFSEPLPLTRDCTYHHSFFHSQVNEGEVYQDISEEELKLAFSKTKYARKFFNALSCGK